MSKRHQNRANPVPPKRVARTAPSPLLAGLVASTTSALEAALSRFAMDDSNPYGIPNYAGFQEWIQVQLRNDPARGLVFSHFNSLGRDITTHSSRLLLEMRKLEQGFRSELEAVRGPLKRTHLAKYNQLKLLMSALSWSERAAEVQDAATRRAAFPDDLDDGLATCTQAELRARLFTSLGQENWRTAFKIVGRLKEEAHDPGELAYLEALTRFHSDDLPGCIRYAAQVAADAIDHAAASALWLEALAYQGSPTLLLERLMALGTASLSPLFLRYLVQITILNSDDAETAARNFNEGAEKIGWQTKNIAPGEDPFLRAFNRHTCSLALRFMEFMSAAELARELSSDEEASEQERAMDPMLARLLLSLMYSDPVFAKGIIDAEPAHQSSLIVRRLMNGPYEPALTDIVQALFAQLRLGEIEPFIDNTVRLVAHFPAGSWPDSVIDVLRAALVEAAARNSPAADSLTEALQRISGSTVDLHSDDVLRKQRLASLTSMGQLAYTWAEDALRRAEGTESWHGDAGMIALGFFRILEHELNELLVAPMRRSEIARLELDEIWSRLGPLLATVDDTMARKSARKRAEAYAMWTQLADRLRDVMNGRRPGLELGSLFLLMEKSRSASGEDIELKQYFAGKLTTHLNEAGRAAFMAGELSQFIEHGVTERFRNPAAHSRFVSLASAQACKRHVDAAVLSLAQWANRDLRT